MSYGYRKLDVFNKSYDLALKLYKVTKKFPKEEIYGLVSQIRRASVSIGANLAEGYSKNYLTDFIRHVSYAIGSFNELEMYLKLSYDLDYLTPEKYNEIKPEHARIGRMQNGLKKGLIKRQKEIKKESM